MYPLIFPGKIEIGFSYGSYPYLPTKRSNNPTSSVTQGKYLRKPLQLMAFRILLYYACHILASQY
jgi:hypothetical protein